MKRYALPLALVHLACAGPLASLHQQAEIQTMGGTFVIHFAGRHESQAKVVQSALQRISGRLTLWGGLKEPVRIDLLGSHRQLEAEVNKTHYPWLRAWAQYDEIFLQSPDTWSLLGATSAALDELLVHELTHCSMYQQAATSTSWRYKQIPPWFREGMASYTAHQGYLWPTLEDLAEFYVHHSQLDPLGAPETIYRNESNIAYGAAHHAFTFLVQRYGEGEVRRTLRAMSEGQTFPNAFLQTIGISPEAFVTDFRHYVKWRAFLTGSAVAARR